MRSLVPIIACLATTAALAQQPPSQHGEMPMKPDFAKALSISPEKAAQVETILAAEREQHRAVHDKARAELAKVLTSQQIETLEQMMPRGPRAGGDRQGAPRR